MTTQTRNEAAERLRAEMQEGFDVSGRTALLDEALAAEYQRGVADGMADHPALAARTRRATVERIRERLIPDGWPDYYDRTIGEIGSVLDEEAAR